MKYEVLYREIELSKIIIEAKDKKDAKNKLRERYELFDLDSDPTHYCSLEELEILSAKEILPKKNG